MIAELNKGKGDSMGKSSLRIRGVMMSGYVLLLLLSGNNAVADSGARFEEKQVDGYKVILSFDAGEAKVGHNKLSIRLSNERGQPVGDASITIIAETYKKAATTPSHGAGMDMENMNNTNSIGTPGETPIRTVKVEMKAGHEIGEYEGEVELDEAGHWMIKVNSLVTQQERAVTFSVDVSKKGPNWLVLGGFFGAIVTFVTVAAVTRRKPAKAAVTEETL